MQAQGHTFETLDDLLSALSPQFQEQRSSLLFAKLAEVASSRAQEE